MAHFKMDSDILQVKPTKPSLSNITMYIILKWDLCLRINIVKRSYHAHGMALCIHRKTHKHKYFHLP